MEECLSVVSFNCVLCGAQNQLGIMNYDQQCGANYV